MKIKKITKFNDRVFEVVLRLLPQLDPHINLPEKQYFKNLLASGNTHFFIAELDNKDIAGMLTIGTYLTPTGMKVWIEDVIVDEPQRGTGIGKDLIQFAIDYAKSLGAIDIRLTSRPTRVAANKLYVKMGFVQYTTNVYKYKVPPCQHGSLVCG
ncbi:MAG TPA: GNAT family N-acetyltransferase [Bacteroidales bacterium]|nr:GNAT family N-acetyltransferase [Bacteroidales bacterium]